MRWIGLILVLGFSLAGVERSGATGKTFVLAADPELIDNGALKYIVPRFALKTQIRPEIVAAGSLDADAMLVRSDAAMPASGVADVVPAIDAGGHVFVLIRLESDQSAFTERFRDWLVSKVGQRTIVGFKIDGKSVYAAAEQVAVETVVAAPTGNVVLGEEIALRRCGRCHVVSKKNRFGGIGSTPSFGALRTLPRSDLRFEAFWTLNPHPSFTQIEGVTEPFDPQRPPPIAPLILTLDEVEALLAFVRTIKPKDLGGPLIAK